MTIVLIFNPHKILNLRDICIQIFTVIVICSYNLQITVGRSNRFHVLQGVEIMTSLLTHACSHISNRITGCEEIIYPTSLIIKFSETKGVKQMSIKEKIIIIKVSFIDIKPMSVKVKIIGEFYE